MVLRIHFLKSSHFKGENTTGSLDNLYYDLTQRPGCF